MAALIQIGNSKGVRIPKAFIEQTQLENRELKFRIVDEGLLIQPIKKVRTAWKEQFEKSRIQSLEADERLWLEAPLTIEKDWKW